MNSVQEMIKKSFLNLASMAKLNESNFQIQEGIDSQKINVLFTGGTNQLMPDQKADKLKALNGKWKAENLNFHILQTNVWSVFLFDELKKKSIVEIARGIGLKTWTKHTPSSVKPGIYFRRSREKTGPQYERIFILGTETLEEKIHWRNQFMDALRTGGYDVLPGDGQVSFRIKTGQQNAQAKSDSHTPQKPVHGKKARAKQGKKAEVVKLISSMRRRIAGYEKSLSNMKNDLKALENIVLK